MCINVYVMRENFGIHFASFLEKRALVKIIAVRISSNSEWNIHVKCCSDSISLNMKFCFTWYDLYIFKEQSIFLQNDQQITQADISTKDIFRALFCIAQIAQIITISLICFCHHFEGINKSYPPIIITKSIITTRPMGSFINHVDNWGGGGVSQMAIL